ncbi:MAG: hypothetical protein GX773_00745 [Chloroflexi bacterium]|nr:hypothetical protein [Chloroflexota bacterium]
MEEWAQLFGENTDCGDEPLLTPFNSPYKEGVRWDVAIAIVQVMEWAQQREMEWNAIPRVPVIDGRDCLDKQ